MSTEYKLPFTANEISEKLTKVDELSREIVNETNARTQAISSLNTRIDELGVGATQEQIAQIETNKKNIATLQNETDYLYTKYFGSKKILSSDLQMGYYASSDGGYKKSEKYMCLIEKFKITNYLIITPPPGYWVSACIYSADGSFVEQLNTGNTNGKPLEIIDKNGYLIGVNIGIWNSKDVASYLTDEFASSIVIKETKETSDLSYIRTENILSYYPKIGICGASWDSGYIYDVDGSVVEKDDMSWVANLCRRNGNELGLYARHSVKVADYLTNQHCLPKLLSDNPCGLYILNFGGNDTKNGLDAIGTIADIETKADTFYGNYANIVEQIRAYAPKAKLVCCMWYHSVSHNDTRKAYSEAVTEIANYYGLPRIKWEDDVEYNTIATTELQGSHPTAFALFKISKCFERLFNVCYKENTEYLTRY